MEPNKVYESIIFLLNNLFKNNDAKYLLLKNSEIKKEYLQQINNMLFLEKEADAKLDEKVYAFVFGKAFAKLTSENLKIVKTENKSIEEIYGEYSILISKLVNDFNFDRKSLTDQNIAISEKEISINAFLAKEDIEKIEYLQQQKEKDKAKIVDIDTKTTTQTIVEPPHQKTFDQNNFNNQNQFNGQNPFGGLGQIPIHPMQDPKFYPFDTKPRLMPIYKWILFGLSCLSLILMYITIIFASFGKLNTTSINLANISGLSDDIKNNIDKFGASSTTLIGGITSSVTTLVFGLILSALPMIYILFDIRKSKVAAKFKYRIGVFIIIFLLVMIGFGIFDIYPVLNRESVTKQITASLINNTTWIDTKDVTSNQLTELTNLVTPLVQALVEAHKNTFNMLESFAIAAIVIMSITILFSMFLLVINPRYDRERMAQANYQHQRKIGALMSGEYYEIDPAIYDIPDNGKSSRKPWFKNKDKWKDNE